MRSHENDLQRIIAKTRSRFGNFARHVAQGIEKCADGNRRDDLLIFAFLARGTACGPTSLGFTKRDETKARLHLSTQFLAERLRKSLEASPCGILKMKLVRITFGRYADGRLDEIEERRPRHTVHPFERHLFGWGFPDLFVVRK